MNKPEFSTTTKGPIAEHYDNFIGGKWAAPRSGKYFDDISPLTGKVVCKIARSDARMLKPRSMPLMRQRTPGVASSSALQSYRGRSLPANSRAALLQKMLNWLPSRFEVALAAVLVALLSAALVLAAGLVPRLQTF
jgi:acyl-CoA reductase-like NAD-dependent aldehyde dehydrogenase